MNRFISYDAPHLGANVPPGLIALRRSLPSLTGWVAPLAVLFSPEVRAIDTPASKQLLLHYYDDANASRHSEFDVIRQTLNGLGNGGYPANCKNIAMLNGHIGGGRQRNAANSDEIRPGSKILGVNIFGILCNAILNAWSNELGSSTKVYSGTGFGICVLIGFNNSYVNIPYNTDRVPGGYNGSDFDTDRQWPIDANINARFSFVPTYSGIDYKGPLNSDNDFTFPIWGNIINNNYQVVRPTLTPFQAIYGDFQNTNHTSSINLVSAWNALAAQEYGISDANGILSGCSLPPPPVVAQAKYAYRTGWNYTTLPGGVCKQSRYWKAPNPNTINLAVLGRDAISNYEQFIIITGPNSYFNSLNVTQTPRAIFDYNNLPTGTYTITARRKYNGTFTGSILSASSTLYRPPNFRT